MGLAFTIMTGTHGPEGVFSGLGSAQSNQRVDKALDDLDMPDAAMGPIAAKLRDVAMRDPDCLEAFATLGYIYAKRGRSKAALPWYEQGVRHAESVVPDGFEGRIEWNSWTNRPFLRCHHGLALTLMELGDWKRSVSLLEQQLKWSPADNQGVRWLLGDALVQVSRYTDAQKQLLSVKEEYPPARYSLAWIYFNQDSYAQALTELRLGFLENVYIAELIAGAIYPTKHRYWHGSNLHEPELAREHHERFIAHKWGAAEREFVSWALQCSAALAERGAYRRLHEILAHEREVARRQSALDELDKLRAGIRNDTSTPWIRRVRNRKGQEHWVWEDEAYA